MTITEIALKVREAGDGVETDFDYGFQTYANTDILVYKITTATGEKTLQTLGTDYTVALEASGPGGTVTYTVAPTAAEESYIVANLPSTQATSYNTNGKFTADSVETALDKLTILIQQVEEAVGRCPKVPYEDDNPPELPELGTNTGYLYYNGSAFSLATP